jgi:hypothetical protein
LRPAEWQQLSCGCGVALAVDLVPLAAKGIPAAILINSLIVAEVSSL